MCSPWPRSPTRRQLNCNPQASSWIIYGHVALPRIFVSVFFYYYFLLCTCAYFRVVKLSNLNRVLAMTSVSDPSAVEKKVLAQTEKRKMSHLLHNEMRKLTPDERKEKKRKKLEEDHSQGYHVAVFKCVLFRVVFYYDTKFLTKLWISTFELFRYRYHCVGVGWICGKYKTHIKHQSWAGCVLSFFTDSFPGDHEIFDFNFLTLSVPVQLHGYCLNSW